jgi:hypothetical protein
MGFQGKELFSVALLALVRFVVVFIAFRQGNRATQNHHHYAQSVKLAHLVIGFKAAAKS